MNKEFIKALDDIEKEKGIGKAVILDALSKALVKSYEENFDSNSNVEISINEITGDINVFAVKEVVEEVSDSNMQTSINEAKKVFNNPSVGDMVRIPVKPENFGRVAAQKARSIIIQKLKDAERETTYDDFKDREKEIINGSVQRVDNGIIFINLGKTEGIVPKAEQIPGEIVKAGDRLKLYIEEVSNTTKGPKITLSRTNPALIIRLFEDEIPEISNGVVEIYSISREAGSRTKIAVYSNDPTVDPVGACVGYKGNRVNAIVDELQGEKIDIIIYDKDIKVFISNSLSPANVKEVFVDEDEKSAIVIVPDEQLSLAIGKEGQNVRLAAKLTSWKIDIKGESDYDNVVKELEEKKNEKLKEDTVKKESVEVEEQLDKEITSSEKETEI